MPRQPRQWVPGIGAHVISRFVDRRFHLVDDADRRAFLLSIEQAESRWDWRWLSYALMSSHVHHGLIPGVVDPDRFFRSAHTRFAQHYHRRRRLSTLGPVFAGRPTLHPVQPDRLRRLVAYHHRNPVEAGVVNRPSDSSWTSHRAYMRLDPAPPWLDVERALDILGFRDTAAGRRGFDEFVIDVDLSRELWCASPEPATQARQSRYGCADSIEWQRLITLAREIGGVPRAEPLDSRRHGAALARRLIAIVATRDLGQTYASVAARLGIDTGSVFNLTVRQRRGDLDGMLAELRRRLIAI